MVPAQCKPYLPKSAVGSVAGPVGEYFLFTLAAQPTLLLVIISSSFRCYQDFTTYGEGGRRLRC